MVEFLIKEGVDVNADDSEGEMYCAQNGNPELCEMLVDRGADPRVNRADGVTALHMAAQNGRIDVCNYLVEDCGLDVNVIASDDYPATPLCLAAGKGYLEVCKYLLSKGAQVDAGIQPLLVAAQV